MIIFLALLIVIAASATQVAARAILPAAIGIRPTAVHFGRGPALFKVGVLTIGPLPVGGSVSFVDSRDADLGPEELDLAIDTQPIWKHVTAFLFPDLVVLTVSSLILGNGLVRGIQTVWSGFFVSALSPLGTAQEILGSYLSLVESSSAVWAFSWMLVVFSALSLLPVGSASGGEALLNLLFGRREDHAFANQYRFWTSLLMIVAVWSWYLAVGVFLLRALVS